jgi:hypothetical protein
MESIDLFTKSITVQEPVKSIASRSASRIKQIFMMLMQFARFLLDWLRTPANWKKKRTWIGAAILLRAAY